MTTQSLMQFDAELSERASVAVRFVWLRADAQSAFTATRYDGHLVTHSEPDHSGAYESTVAPVSFTSSEPPRIVAYRVALRGDEEVYRLPYTTKQLYRRANNGGDVPEWFREAL